MNFDYDIKYWQRNPYSLQVKEYSLNFSTIQSDTSFRYFFKKKVALFCMRGKGVSCEPIGMTIVWQNKKNV